MRVRRAQARLCGRDARAPRAQPTLISALYSVIPAKAGIQTLAVRSAIRNQVQIPTSGSLLPLWKKARMRVRRAQARLCGRDARAPRAQPTLISALYPVIPAKAGIQTLAVRSAIRNQVQIPTSGSLLPSWEKARMRVSPRASAALRARRPRSQASPKPAPIRGFGEWRRVWRSLTTSH